MANNSGYKVVVREELYTPKGKAQGFVALQTPSDKFKKEGEYSVKIRVNKKEGEALLEKIKAIRKQALEQIRAEGAKPKAIDITCVKPLGTTTSDDDGNEIFTPDPSGDYIIKASKRASFEKEGKVIRTPVLLIDGKKKQIKKELNMGAGSELKLKVTVEGYYFPAQGVGVSMKLSAVQVLNVVERTTDLSGFEEEDDAFDSDNLPEAVTPEAGNDEEEEL